MPQFLTIDPQDLFSELVERGRAQGVTDQEAYNQLCDDLLMEKLEVGEADEDSNIIGLREQLKNRWPDYQEALGLGGEQPQL